MNGQGNGKNKNPPKPPGLGDSSFENSGPSLSSGVMPPRRGTPTPAPAAKPKPVAKPGMGLKPRVPGRGPPGKNGAAQDDEAAAAKKAAQEAATLRNSMAKTGFSAQTAQARQQALLGSSHVADEEEEELSLPPVAYDGQKPDPAVASTDLWKAIHAPVQSREGKRTVELYRQVLDQFAVGNNPRYHKEPDGRSRAHIFIWDVSKAMGSEIPHFMGSRELSLIQTVDWIRYEGGGRGWLKCELVRALQAADAGHPVIALPKELKIRTAAMVRPEDRAPDGKPLFAAANERPGNRLTIRDALGVFAVEYYFHA